MIHRVSALGLIFILGCVSTKPQAEFSADPTRKEVNDTRVRAELAALDGQIAHLNAMIESANARLQSYQFLSASHGEGMIANTKAEITNYEFQKNALVQRRQQLQAE